MNGISINPKEKKRLWWGEVRGRVFPAHEFAKQTHCRDCRRRYNRGWMRRKRNGLSSKTF